MEKRIPPRSFDPHHTKYFYWLIPESDGVASVGLIADHSQEAETCLKSFLQERNLDPLEFQAAMVPIHRYRDDGHILSPGRNIFIMGDDAAQVKMSTVGGIVTGLYGARALAKAILNKGNYGEELHGLKHELDLHLLIRSVLNRFQEKDYDNLIALLDGSLKDVLEKWTRDELRKRGALLRRGPSHAAEVPGSFLDAGFRGGRLGLTHEVAVGNSPRLEVFRARTLPSELALDRGGFGRELAALVSAFESVETAEFLITKIAVEGRLDPRVRTSVRFDIAGPARGGGRAERVGVWEMAWRHGADWRVTEWKTLDHRRSRAPAPVFAEATGRAFGRSSAFRDQLVPGLDEWASRLDALFMPRGMGHHGVSVGDADGDGLDDIYVSQPEGLPNRLFRNEGVENRVPGVEYRVGTQSGK